MRFFASRILLLAFNASACTIFCHAFTIPTLSLDSISTAHPQVAISSPLFNQCSERSLTNRLCTASLKMSVGEEGGAPDNEASTEVPSTDITTSSTDTTEETPEVNTKKKKERSGFVTALILGPPLITKFAIVLLVKFLTDVVVFPFLIFYRFVKMSKNKVVGLFTSSSGKDGINGDDVNGASPSSTTWQRGIISWGCRC